MGRTKIKRKYIIISICFTVTGLIRSKLPYYRFRSHSAGKLVNYRVEDGGHVFTGDVFAEIEVMKMLMELRVSESGWSVYIYVLRS